MKPVTSIIAAAVVAAAAASACADIGAPLRLDIYEWRRFEGSDTVSFHWPQEYLPVRIWVEDQFNLPAFADASIAQWRQAFLYHEYDAVQVPDSTGADVIVRYGPVPPGDDLLLDRGAIESFAPECQATTLPNVDVPLRIARLPMHVYLTARFDPSLPGTQACLALTLTHEIGHTLGLFAHSPHPEDIMYANPTVAVPSERDRTTAEVLYHQPATVRPSRRP